MAYRLVNIKTGKILQVCEGDFMEFLNTKWGGWFPFKMPGTNLLSDAWGLHFGCVSYDAYWEEFYSEKFKAFKKSDTQKYDDLDLYFDSI